MAIVDSFFMRGKQSQGIRRIILHICRNPFTGVWVMMNELCKCQNRLPGQLAVLGVLADRNWHNSYRSQLADLDVPYTFCQVPTLFGTGAYLLFIISNPVRDWVRRLRSTWPAAEAILHFHSAWMTGSFFPLPHHESLGIISTFHGVQDHQRLRNDTWRRLAHRFMARRLASSKALLTCVTKQTAEAAEDILGITQNRFRIIPNGLEDPGYYCNSRNAGKDVFTVGHVGQMHPGKGWDLLLQAVDHLHSEGLNIRLILAGTGQDEERARAESSTRSDYVKFLGFVPEAGKTLIPSLDALVLATWWEGMPVSVIEAFASGVPVLGTRVGGVEEMIVDGVNGLFIERDPISIAECVRKLIDDPELHRRMKKHARSSFLEKYSISAVVKAYDMVYQDSLAESHAGVR